MRARMCRAWPLPWLSDVFWNFSFFSFLCCQSFGPGAVRTLLPGKLSTSERDATICKAHAGKLCPHLLQMQFKGFSKTQNSIFPTRIPHLEPRYRIHHRDISPICRTPRLAIDSPLLCVLSTELSGFSLSLSLSWPFPGLKVLC